MNLPDYDSVIGKIKFTDAVKKLMKRDEEYYRIIINELWIHVQYCSNPDFRDGKKFLVDAQKRLVTDTGYAILDSHYNNPEDSPKSKLVCFVTSPDKTITNVMTCIEYKKLV